MNSSTTAFRSSDGGNAPWARMKSLNFFRSKAGPSDRSASAADLEQPAVAHEVRGRLARRAEGVALDLLHRPSRPRARRPRAARGSPRPRVIVPAWRPGSRNARAARMQPELERDQLALERLVGLRLGLGVEGPAFDVHAVHREDRAGDRHALLDHRGELELVARPPLVRGQRPRRRLEGEVVEALASRRTRPGCAAAARTCRARRCSRSSAAAACWARVPRRSRPRSRARSASSRCGSVTMFPFADDLLELADAALVVREDRLARELLLLQLADHVAVVGRCPSLLLRDQRRQRLHLVLDLLERDLRAALQLRPPACRRRPPRARTRRARAAGGSRCGRAGSTSLRTNAS